MTEHAWTFQNGRLPISLSCESVFASSLTVSQTVKVHHVDEQPIKSPNLASALETNCILYNVLQMCNNPYSGGDKNTSCENKCTLMEEIDKE